MSTIIPLNKILVVQSHDIGDVVLTLPLIGVIKHHYPNCEVILVAKEYTRAIAESCKHVSKLIEWDLIQSESDEYLINLLKNERADAILFINPDARLARLAKRANIPYRVGAMKRLYNWLYCNRLVNFSKRFSRYHESQDNLCLLKPFGIVQKLSMTQLIEYSELSPKTILRANLRSHLCSKRFNLIIHPGSNGHSREWPAVQFVELINSLSESDYNVIVTGQAHEQTRFQEILLDKCPAITSLMGKMNLSELVSFIHQSDGLIASSTGPLHIAAAVGINALGLFPPRTGNSPRRWAPIGIKASHLVYNRPKFKLCLNCTKDQAGCNCMLNIQVRAVKDIVSKWKKDSKVANESR